MHQFFPLFLFLPQTESPLHTVNEQLGLLLGKLGTDSSDDDGGTAAFVAGSGCLQCLKQDDLMTLIGVMVKGQLGDLEAEVASQKQQILAVSRSTSLSDSVANCSLLGKY